VQCRIHKDGRVETRSGAQDIGTGFKTVLAALTAEELGIDIGLVRAYTGDTRDPAGPGSGGSTTTPSVAPAARLAAAEARHQLEAIVADHLNVAADTVRCAGGKVGTKDKQIAFADACKLMTAPAIEASGVRSPNAQTYQPGVHGCQFAEVEVDAKTGVVKVLSMLAVRTAASWSARRPPRARCSAR
jgi:xanthine dehydrogenase YagR molybdenum-binding subunit